MIKLKSDDKDLILVDDVLKLLLNNINQNTEFEHIINELEITKISITFDEEDKPPLIFDYVCEKSWETNYYLASCLTYLIQNGFVICPIKDEFRITYKGVVKLKTNSFTEEGFQAKWGKPKDFYLFILALISFIITLFSLFC